MGSVQRIRETLHDGRLKNPPWGLPGQFVAFHGETNVYLGEDLQEVMDYCEALSKRIASEPS